MNERILLKNSETGPVDLEGYRREGGFEALERAVRKGRPLDVLEEIKRSGLRGRGGAGFPTGKKWEMVATHRSTERYLVCNAGEHEPGTYKDRFLLLHNPFQLIEGITLGVFAVGAKSAYLFIDATFTEQIDRVRKALDAARREGFLGPNLFGTGFSCDIDLFLGPHAYVAGEETAMLQAIQGQPAKPKPKPPYYPTVHGLYGRPTLVNNVETFSNVPHIIRNGSDWFRSFGTPTSPGTMLFSLSGSVTHPGVYEVPLGIPLRRLIEKYGGGINDGRPIKAVYPGGPSLAFLMPKDLDVPMDFDSLRAAGTGLGSAGVIVLDDTQCMVEQTMNICRFFEMESCGQCPPCQMGTHYLHLNLEKIENGHGRPEDLQTLRQLSGFVKGRGDCTVITGAAVAVETSLRHFSGEFEEHVREQRCSLKVAG